MRWRALVGTALVAVLLAPVTAHADDPKDERKKVLTELAATEDDLHESSQAVQEAAAALRKAAVELPRAQAHLDATQGRLSAAQAAADASRRDLERAQAAVAAGERDLIAARDALDETRRRSGEMSRSIYKAGPGGVFTAAFRGSPSDFVDRAAFVRVILADRNDRVRDATAARIDVANRASVLADRRADVARRDADVQAALRRVRNLVDAARAARAAVVAQVTARRRAMAVAERERAADLAHYRTLQAESARLAELIRRAAIARPKPPRDGGGRVSRSGLLWPTPGPVTSGYGYRVHPIYGYRRLHAGIDIGAPTGQGIVAVLAGTVVTAGPMGSYGNLVVVDHGDGFATAYAHQSRVLVSEGQRVTRGQRIGLVGSTGASTGPHLHFETRVNGEPVDPMRYY